MHPNVRSRTVLALTAALFVVSSRADAQDAPPQDPPPQAPPAGEPPAGEPVRDEPAPDEPAPPAPAPDAPAPPAPDAPAGPVPADRPDTDPAPTDEQDAEARKALVAAAERQGGAALAPPDGAVASFRIVFGKVTVYREEENAERGLTRSKLDSDDPGLVVHWKGGQIRTAWRLVGKRETVRALLVRDGREVPWMHDGGDRPTILIGPAHEKDRAEIERDRRIVRALLDVAVLRSLLVDGSRWKLVDDPLHPGLALRRTPPEGAPTQLRLTLWIDPKSNDVTSARLSPNEPGESTMHYDFEYDDEYPAVKDAVLRFPFRFTVREQRIPEQEPMLVMVATAREASFNDVDDAVFTPPKPQR